MFPPSEKVGFFERWREKWAAWLGDKDLERGIRQALTEAGYFGDSARLRDLRLAAVQRPGWLQILIFSAEARPAHDGSEPRKLAGIVRQDERYNRQEIRVFQRTLERNELFDDWSTDLVKLRRLT